ncbi:hypothetical protein VFPFJ_06864 [Purpureocillium lilacinum]|uniref:Uncharacterized protein n=1 Tax=Purpureocillium lilacinum TaxID=33203 RepID=A0A179HG08_PURLI|nr:hypothetical protein VFPFJ_06864 [Purpureocillium lilacinum]OAQ88399.1 hypothetical protein VFPFJ_06864 [Purpureocillium lilacinum]
MGREGRRGGGRGGVAGRDAVRPGGRNGLVHDGVRVWGVVLLLLLWLWRRGRWDRSSYGIVVGVAVVVVVVVLLLCCLSARGGSALAPSERAPRTTLYLLRDTSSYTSYRLACRYVRCKTKSPTPRTELRACSVSPS